MPYGIYISAEGAQAQGRRMEILANNLANVETPGFKRDLATLQARYAEETKRGTDYFGSHTINDLSGGVMVRDSRTDFSPGSLRKTDISTDMALNGDGFFVVDKGGEKHLTRAGNFRVTAAGQLQTQNGYSVLSEDGQPITLDPEAGPFSVQGDGTITQGGASVTLAVAKPKSFGDLVKVGENLFKPLAPTESLPATDRHVSQGYQEMSSVKPTTEMMELIEASRSFEANTNIIRSQDQMLGGLINRVLKA